jgi:amino-acid N-acetyltransferase
MILDVVDILDLINHYASANLMLPRGPQYLYENIRDFVIVADCSAPVYSLVDSHQELHLIVACGSMHECWG